MGHLHVYSAGSNARGQLGNGTVDDSSTFATRCVFPKSVDQDSKSMSASASQLLRPLNLLPSDNNNRCHQPINSIFPNIATGANHSLILFNSNHHLYGVGDNSRGQLTGATTATETTSFERVQLDLESDKYGYQVVDIAAAWETSYFVLRHKSLLIDDGGPNVAQETIDFSSQSPPAETRRPLISDVLVTVGSNDFGALGIGSLDPPTAVSSPSTPKGKEKISVSLSSIPSSQQHVLSFTHLLPPATKSSYLISSITTGINHVIVVLDVYSKDNPQQRPSQLVVGWGACRHGQLGPMSSPASAPPVAIRPSSKSPKSSQQPKLAPKAKPSTSKSNSPTPQPPSFIPTPILLQVKNASPVKRVGAGSQHTVLLHEDGTLTTWGSNRKNQLPSTNPPRVFDVRCTWNGTYLVKNASSSEGNNTSFDVLAIGSGEKGQLGRAAPSSSSTSSSSSSPAPPSSDLYPVDLPPTPDHRIRKLACGSEHVLLLLEKDADKTTDLYLWGWNEHGNLGLNHNQDVFTPLRLPWTRGGRIVDVWAGCGTSWLVVEEDD
ncbi:hypothetical protein FRC04_007302 [Tulasnella sp. 424]|nr:hypothetical protein FRC04_007302 [Tulasnella sp. 424]KAG8976230.1 hypothetical protein FRC05_004480 [Tulasnella sp. 425]